MRSDRWAGPHLPIHSRPGTSTPRTKSTAARGRSFVRNRSSGTRNGGDRRDAYALNKKTRLKAGLEQTSSCKHQRLLTASLNALPAVNLTVFAAGILMVSPVFGL